MSDSTDTSEDNGAHTRRPAPGTLPRLDLDSSPDEQLPGEITMVFRQRIIGGVKLVSQSWNGVNIGDSLSDNRAVEDGYRFHDVFHLAYYALLGWSPVLRLLLGLKRISQPAVEESQDGLRAVLIEEAVSILVFTHARALQFFEGARSLDPGLLGMVQSLVAGYEVEARQPREWAEAILQGYAAFRALQANTGGVITASLDRHSLSYRRLES
jgi:hypothetical protein